MTLKKQIHLYNVDTASFYTDNEKAIGDKISRLYFLKSKLKDKKNKDLANSQNKRIAKIINTLKAELIQEFENTRSFNRLRELREESIKDTNIISIFESNLVRELKIPIDSLTMDLMIVQVYFFQVAEDLIKNGFMFRGEKYVLFSASAGQIRTKKFVVIKESKLKQIENTLTCGLSWDIINSKGGINSNKYLAYYALNSSATEIIQDFDIDKTIVVDDFETMVKTDVDYIDDENFEITRKTMDVLIPHMDGCGIWINRKNSMVRLPWIKGLMGKFPFDDFIREKRVELNDNNIGVVKDVYGKVHDIIEEGIECIFTASQFKMWQYYDSYDDYKNNFKKYNCKACFCNEEQDYIKKAKINYQMLQTLSDITESEFKQIAKDTIKDIKNIGYDYRTNMRLLGVHENSRNWMQKALYIYPELTRDTYNHMILKDVKTSIIKEAKAGRLNVNGKYTFVMPDLYAFCEWLFLGIENPKGLIDDGEVICNLYENNHKLCCLRSPHLYREWGLRKNKINTTTDKWFKGSKAIYVSVHDILSKLLMFDCDGDILLVIDDEFLYNIAERNMKDVVPLYYNMKKAHKKELNYNNLFEGLRLAYTSANIGIVSNNISKVWNSENVTQEQIDVVKLMCMQNNFVIDYAKTLYLPTPPKDKKEMLKKYTSLKLPKFFIYAKNKSESQVQTNDYGVVNKISAILPDYRMRYDSEIKKPDVNVLLSKEFDIDLESDIVKEIIETYDYWNRRQSYLISVSKLDKERKQVESELYAFKKIREEILKLPYDKDFIINVLIKFIYTKRKYSNKKLLWASFGEELYNNIKKNTEHMNPICPICGKRFKGHKNRKYCSNFCYRKANRK